MAHCFKKYVAFAAIAIVMVTFFNVQAMDEARSILCKSFFDEYLPETIKKVRDGMLLVRNFGRELSCSEELQRKILQTEAVMASKTESDSFDMYVSDCASLGKRFAAVFDCEVFPFDPLGRETIVEFLTHGEAVADDATEIPKIVTRKQIARLLLYVLEKIVASLLSQRTYGELLPELLYLNGLAEGDESVRLERHKSIVRRSDPDLKTEEIWIYDSSFVVCDERIDLLLCAGELLERYGLLPDSNWDSDLSLTDVEFDISLDLYERAFPWLQAWTRKVQIAMCETYLFLLNSLFEYGIKKQLVSESGLAKMEAIAGIQFWDYDERVLPAIGVTARSGWDIATGSYEECFHVPVRRWMLCFYSKYEEVDGSSE